MARRRISRRKSVPAALVVLAALVWLARDLPRELFAPRPAPEGPWRTVVRIVDADTFDLEDGERIRPIGVDAPETRHRTRGVEPCGPEATAFTRRLLLGKRVRLAYDWQRYDNTERQRTLAYVYLEDGTFFNAEIIRQGYAHAYRKFTYRHRSEFIALEREAHLRNVGCLPQRAPDMPRE